MAYNLDLEYYQNDLIDFSLVFWDVVNDVSTPNNDLNSYDWKMDVKESQNDTALAFSSTTGGISTVDAVTL